jgi:hypothetical protein
MDGSITGMVQVSGDGPLAISTMPTMSSSLEGRHETKTFLKGVVVYTEFPVGLLRINVSPTHPAVKLVGTIEPDATLGEYVIVTGVGEATNIVRG